MRSKWKQNPTRLLVKGNQNNSITRRLRNTNLEIEQI
jgi:hypothetical protein